MSGLYIFGFVIECVWAILTFQVPGFFWTAGQMVVSLLLINMSLAFLSLSVGVGQRSGHSGKHRTSEKRRYDTK